MYKYEDFKEWLSSIEGQRALIKSRDNIFSILEKSGAITMIKAIDLTEGISNNWEQLALIDRLVELEELVEIKQVKLQNNQNRVYIRRY